MYNKNKNYKTLLIIDLAIGFLIYIGLVLSNASLVGPLNEIVMTPAEGAFIFIITVAALSLLYAAGLHLVRLISNKRQKEEDSVYIVRKANFRETVRNIPLFMGRIALIAIGIEFISIVMRALLILPIFVSIYYDRIELLVNTLKEKSSETNETIEE